MRKTIKDRVLLSIIGIIFIIAVLFGGADSSDMHTFYVSKIICLILLAIDVFLWKAFKSNIDVLRQGELKPN